MVIRLRFIVSFLVLSASMFHVIPSASPLPSAAAMERNAVHQVIGTVVEPAESRIQQQVRRWIAQLSKQQPFESWKQAKPDIQALGPGTHGWLATLKTADGQIVGYMVVHAAVDGTLRLSEYGVGPNALYDPAMLDTTLRENGLIATDATTDTAYRAVKYYAHPFVAVWQVSVGSDVYWVDAKTSEILPLKAQNWDQLRQRLSPGFGSSVDGSLESAGFDGAVVTCRIGETFDAYERLPWLTGESPLSLHDEEEVQRRLRGSLHLRYVIEPFGDAALYAVPVVGFLNARGHRLDLAVDMAGTRFIPLATLRSFGRFYA